MMDTTPLGWIIAWLFSLVAFFYAGFYSGLRAQSKETRKWRDMADSLKLGEGMRDNIRQRYMEE